MSTSGYEALWNSAAWLDLELRGRIEVRGEDRLRFLHAMASNAVESLEPGQGTRAFFLDLRGHILADCRIHVAEDHLLVDTEPETCGPLIEHLEKFIIMDDVTLEDRGQALACLAIEGPKAETFAASIAGDLPEQPGSHRLSEGVWIVRDSATGQPGFRFLFEAARKTERAKRLAALGLPEASADDQLAVRVENQVARHGADFFDSTLPQESQRLEAVSFTKGCYLGQEIVERVRSRGQVRRLLVGVEIETADPPETGADVLFEGKKAGELTSPVFSPRLGKTLGFALLKREAAEAGTGLEVAGWAARVREWTPPVPSKRTMS